MANKEISLFGLYDVSIKYPTDPANSWVKCEFVTDATYKGAVSTVDQTGDDALQGYFYHTQKGTITVKCSKLTMAVMAKTSGNTVTSGATTNPLAVSGTAEIMEFQTLSELTPPILAVRATINGRRSDGTLGTCTAYWYKTQVATSFESFPSPSYGKIDEITLTFDAFISQADENNAALTVPSFGRVEVY